MNSKKICFFICFIAWYNFAQGKALEEHMAGESRMGFALGKGPIGACINGGYSYYLTAGLFANIQGFYEWGKPHQFKYTSYAGAAQINYNFLNIDEIVYFNAGLGPIATYDQVSPTRDGKSINYGGIVTAGIEALINERLSCNFSANQSLLMQKRWGSTRFNLSFGFAILL